MVSLQVHTVNTIFRENDKATGFIFITIATGGSRHYRITRSTMLTSLMTKSVDYLDFLLTLTDYPQGNLVMLEIPYRNENFKSDALISTPTELPRIQSPSSEVFKGVVFNLLYVSGYVNDGHTLMERLLRAEVPSLIDFTKTYVIGDPIRQIRFIYYRLVNGVPRYTGYLGNVVIEGQYVEKIDIDPTKSINELEIAGITYYVIQVTATPNVITASGINIDKSIMDEYVDGDGLRYVVMSPSIKILGGKPFYVYLSVFRTDGTALTLSDIAMAGRSLQSNSLGIGIIKAISYGANGTMRISLTLTKKATFVDFRLFVSPL